MTSYNPDRHQLIDTYRELGTVTEVFRMSHQGKAESLMREYAGRAATWASPWPSGASRFCLPDSWGARPRLYIFRRSAAWLSACHAADSVRASRHELI